MFNQNTDQSIELIAESFLNYSNFIESAIVIVILVLIHFAVKFIIYRQIENETLRYKWKKNLSYFIGFIGFILVGRIWFVGMASLATFLGLVTAGLAIALREPVTDLAGWLFIIWSRPFVVGDRIQVGQHKGDVIDVRMFKFIILETGNWVEAEQSTGRIIHIPNHYVLRKSIANYTSDFDFVWNEIPVTITFESNWKKAKEIISEVVNNHMKDNVTDAAGQIRRAKKSYLIRFKTLTPIIYTEVVESGVKLTIRHLSHARKRRGINHKIWENILERFSQEEDITFAYSRVRIYQHPLDEKPESTSE